MATLAAKALLKAQEAAADTAIFMPLPGQQAPATMSAREGEHEHPPHGRFLSESFYRHEVAKFRTYKPAHWCSTLKLNPTCFMLKPWLALVIVTVLLTKIAKDYAPNVLPWVSLSPIVHTILGSALSFIVVFRTNSAYARWSEGRLLWGKVTNAIRSVAARAKPMMHSDDFERLIKQSSPPSQLGELLSEDMVSQFQMKSHPPFAAIAACSLTVQNGIRPDRQGIHISGAAFLTLQTALDEIGQAGGGMERVKNTPTPFGYIATLRVLTLLWLSTMPFILIGSFGWFAPAAIGLLGFLFLNMEQMAMRFLRWQEIEEPFGDDGDDLPLESYCLTIENALLDIIRK